MSDAPESVLVLGATGTHGGAVARGLLAAGYQVRALVRDSSSSRTRALADAGATLVPGDLLDVASLTPAFTEVDAVYAVTTPFENGPAGEERQGEAIIAAAETAGLAWLVLASVASADKVSSVPHFASKWQIEQRLAAGSVPWTVIAPGYFYENVLGSMPAINGGQLPIAIPPDKPLAQVALANLGQLVATVLAQRGEHLGVRVEVAGDDPTPLQMAAAFGVQYEHVPFATVANPDVRAMYEFLSEYGYSVDPRALHARYPEVDWITYTAWASALSR
jgi:uncharacterized protein YbjT (DUF2867 family)